MRQSLDLVYLHNVAEMLLPKSPMELDRQLRAAFNHLELEINRGRILGYGLATWNCFRLPQQNPSAVSLSKTLRSG